MAGCSRDNEIQRHMIRKKYSTAGGSSGSAFKQERQNCSSIEIRIIINFG